MMKVTHLKTIPKISELVDEFWDNQKNNFSYSATTENDKIAECALDFMTFNCGRLWQDVTDDSNLNEQLINIFAQDFIRQFWNNRIAFDNSDVFYIKLRSFLDQWLPVWGQFYKEAILDKAVFITNLGQVTTNQTGLLHVEGLSSGATSSKGGTTSTTSGTNSATTDGKTTQNTTTNGNTTTSVNGKTTTTGTDTTTKNDSTSTDTQSMNVVADTPQDLNATNFAKTDSKGVGAKPLGAYNFSYASSVNGKHDAVTTKTTGTDSVEHNTTVADNSTTTGESDTTTSVNGTNHSETTGKNDSTTTTQNNNAITNSSNNRSDQNSSSVGNTATKARNMPISQIAKEFSELANGAYLRVFMQAKKAGLFLGVY